MKKRVVAYAPEAGNDLLRLYDWIADAAGERVALGYVRRIEAHCAALDLAAERGRRRDDLRPGLRIAAFERRVTIAFSVDDGRVTILRIFYGGRDWESALAP